MKESTPPALPLPQANVHGFLYPICSTLQMKGFRSHMPCFMKTSQHCSRGHIRISIKKVIFEWGGARILCEIQPRAIEFHVNYTEGWVSFPICSIFENTPCQKLSKFRPFVIQMTTYILRYFNLSLNLKFLSPLNLTL